MVLGVAVRSGWEIADRYVDRGISGEHSREKRPEFDRLHKDACRRRFDVVAVWSIDRLGRRVRDLLQFVSHIHAVGVDLVAIQQGVDTRTPAGMMMFQVFATISEYEKSLLKERVRSGLNRAK